MSIAQGHGPVAEQFLQVLARSDPVADELLSIYNAQAFDRRMPSLSVSDPSQVDKQGRTAVQPNILNEHLDPRRKSLKLGNETKLPEMMQELPPLISDLQDHQFPVPAALAYEIVNGTRSIDTTAM